jgi:hypothetical protein
MIALYDYDPLELSPNVDSEVNPPKTKKMIALYDYDPLELSPNVDSQVKKDLKNNKSMMREIAASRM